MVHLLEEAAPAYEDLMHGEPCVCVAPDGVYVATRVKRALCKGLSAPLKTVKDVEACVAALAPDKPLKSLSMVGNDPPSCNQYNTFVMGAAAKLDKELPATIGLVAEYLSMPQDIRFSNVIYQAEQVELFESKNRMCGQP